MTGSVAWRPLYGSSIAICLCAGREEYSSNSNHLGFGSRMCGCVLFVPLSSIFSPLWDCEKSHGQVRTAVKKARVCNGPFAARLRHSLRLPPAIDTESRKPLSGINPALRALINGCPCIGARATESMRLSSHSESGNLTGSHNTHHSKRTDRIGYSITLSPLNPFLNLLHPSRAPRGFMKSNQSPLPRILWMSHHHICP